MWTIHGAAVPEEVCERARRRLGLEIRRCGLSVQDIQEWSHGTWWPSLREDPAFEDVRWFVEGLANTRGTVCWAETQILVRLPDEDDTERGPGHLDELPPWADGWRYRAIFGVELTQGHIRGGGTVLLPENGPVLPILNPGDVLEMEPDLLHSGSPNLTGDIRMALFFRLLERV